MNYFAHGRHYVDDPYFLAGTALPDLLNVVDRRVRVRSKHAAPFVEHDDVRLASFARGVLQHHHDDAWFHATPAFAELSWDLTLLVRDAVGADDEGFRPSFLGHILVEILLDAVLIAESPERLEAYYRAIDAVDPQYVQAAVNRMARVPTERLAEMIPLFSRERFLSDYADDDKLWYRLNQVLRRVRLPALPAAFCRVLPDARRRVASRKRGLLAAASD